MKTSKFFGLHAKPGKTFGVILMLIPFLLIIGMYIGGSQYRHLENAKDKVMPTIEKMVDTTIKYAIEKDRKGNYVLLNDAVSSLRRIILGISLAAFVGLMLGMNTALFPGMQYLLNPFITFFSNIPPLALMPIFLITMGTGEVSKVGLIFVGTVFMITRDVYRATNEIPEEQITKALTLGATQLEVVYKIVLPQIIPSLLSTIRISLGAAWLFLIAGEAIASTDGLGYRIYLVKRYMAMDVIIPYVLTITGLAYTMDRILKKFVDWKYPWFVAMNGGKS